MTAQELIDYLGKFEPSAPVILWSYNRHDKYWHIETSVNDDFQRENQTVMLRCGIGTSLKGLGISVGEES